MTHTQIESVYEMVKEYHEKYLIKFGVKLPKLKDSKGNFTKDALVLCYLARFYPSTVLVTKKELTQFIRKFDENVNDVQQARHLGAQKGWFISAGGRDNVHVHNSGEYRLISLELPYPHFKGHRINSSGDWGNVKQQYGNRCATCGSKEGERNFHYPNTITKLQKAHIDSSKPLEAGNIFPQCQKCNMAYRDFWVFDERGRVRSLAKASLVKRWGKEIKIELYKILYKEFKRSNPNE